MALVNQIASIVNDAVNEALGDNRLVHDASDTTNFVSLGKALSDANKFDAFYKALTNRIVRTLYFVRTYEPSSRHVLRDEAEYGAFVQKVYYELPTAGDNATYQIPDASGAFTQKSPYDVSASIGVSAEIFGGKGTWSIEFIRPIDQIKTAFTSPADMAAFIDGIYLTAENAFKLELEAVENLAVNTGAAAAISSSNTNQKRDLLSEYNALKKAESSTWTAITATAALRSADFLKFASKEINKVTTRMQRMSMLYNAESYNTFTPADKMVVEVLTEFAAATASYLEADTYHKELVALPNYNEVPFWQENTGDLAQDSFINIKNTAISAEEVATNGIICMVRDVDAVACYFGERKSWEMVNPRSDVIIHGEKAVRGYGVDKHANFVVFTLGDM